MQQEITYTNFRKELFKNPYIASEVCKVPPHAEPFQDVTKEDDVPNSNINVVPDVTSQTPTDGISISGTSNDYLSL